MTKLENVLVWLYVKTWGKFGDHVIAEKSLWNFSENDLRTALMDLAYPKKDKNTERVQALTDLIMEKFEQDSMAFLRWSVKIHQEVIDSPNDFVDQRSTVKILQWDPGNYWIHSLK